VVPRSRAAPGAYLCGKLNVDLMQKGKELFPLDGFS
jgi:hypothetical protein